MKTTKTTIRFHMNPNEANLAHNTDEKVRAREDHIKVDPKTGHTLEIWCSNYSSAEEAIADILSEDLKEYNKKTRKSRQMTMEQYIQSVKDDKRGKKYKVKYKKSDGTTGYRYEKREQKRMLYEGVVSCGNSSYDYDAFGKVRYDKNNRHIRPQEVPYEVNCAVCKRYYETFEERNPNFKLVNFVWHNEEGFYNKRRVWEYSTAHGQFCYTPIGTGYKQGLARQVSIGRALENMGYVDTYEDYVDENGETQSRWVCAYTLWERAEVEYLEQLLQEEYEKYCKKHKAYAMTHGKLEIIHPVKGRNVDSLSPKEYAEKRRLEEEEAEAAANKTELIEECHELARAVSKKKKFGKKVLVPEDEYNSILPAAEVVSGMEESKIASDRTRRIAEEMQEAAEDKYNELDKLCTNEREYINAQAQLIANKMQQKYEEDTDHEKEEYSRLVEKQKSYILTCAKLISEKALSSFAKLDEQKKKKILSHIYKELDLDNISANEPELSF